MSWSSIASYATGLLLLALVVDFHGCTAHPANPEDEYVPEPAPQMPRFHPEPARLPAQVFEDRSGAPVLDGYVEDHADEIAGFDVAVFHLRFLLSDKGAILAEELRGRNPNIVILGVLQVLSIPDAWGDEWQRETYPLTAELYDLLWSRQLTTTSGQTAYMWSEAPMLNPYRKRSFDLSLLRAQMDIIARHASRYPDTFDGIFHDYMSGSPWLYPEGPTPEEDADLDGDGIGYRSDPDEAAAWVGWQKELLRELQSRFGEGLIQVANGRLPIDDDEVASLCAGVLYQNFPRTVWNWPDLRGLETAIEQMESKLTPRRGRVWTIFGQQTSSRVGMAQFRRIASMLTGQFYVYVGAQTDAFYGEDPVQIDLGAPLAPFVRTDLEDGAVHFERSFEGGKAVIDIAPSGYATYTEVEPNP